MNKIGDIVMVFGNPITLQCPVGQAKLILLQKDMEVVQEWKVQYLDDESNEYNVLIKKV